MTKKVIIFFVPVLIVASACGYSLDKNSFAGKAFAEVAIQANQYADISFASTDERFSQDQEPFAQPVLQQTINAWKNEKISCQVLIWAKTSLTGFKLALGNKSDTSISHSAIHFGFLKNVASNLSGGLCGSVPKDLPEIQIADVISNDASGDIVSGKLQAIWITIQVPKNITEGAHIVNIKPESQEGHDFPMLNLTINVNKNILPDPAQWKFHLDLWQHPLRVAKYYNVKPWSAEHFNAMKPTMQMLANAGQKAITASFFWDIMNNENYGFENLMVKVNRNANGPLQFDFTNFDKWIAFMMSLGIKEQINCFGMYPFTNNLNYYITDPAQNKTVAASFALASNDYKAFWTSFLRAFAQHLREKNWMDKAVLYFDERPPKAVMEIVTLIKRVDPAFKIGYSGGYNATLNSVLYDFSIPSYLKIDNAALDKRTQNNLVTTFYTTCYEKRPNLFTYSSPAESAFMGWYAFANGYNGYLRYALNMWEKNSLTDTRSVIVPAGDKFIIYPDSYSSVRFEKLIEGIQDYERLNLLTASFNNSKNKNALKKMNAVLSTFKLENTKNISDYITLLRNAKALVNSF